MKLIVGLGNPGSEYTQTRHNIGFMVADELANHYHASFSTDKKLKADIAKFEYRDESILIAKPQTYMNLSGDSVRLVMDYYKVALEDVWVLSDDLDLEFGTVRIRQGGGSGGHNGLRDIIQKIGEDLAEHFHEVGYPEAIKWGLGRLIVGMNHKWQFKQQPRLPKTTFDLKVSP
jgi:PTH1 family peptidyl-tRNA hydrolase